jgi:hypothetical protein
MIGKGLTAANYNSLQRSEEQEENAANKYYRLRSIKFVSILYRCRRVLPP